MIDWLSDIFTWWTTGLMGVLLYWVPTAFCLVGYAMKCWQDYSRDVKAREDKFYNPSLHVGTIIGRAILSVVPVANLFAGMFDVAPNMFWRFMRWIESFFSIPLVKPRPKDTTSQEQG